MTAIRSLVSAASASASVSRNQRWTRYWVSQTRFRDEADWELIEALAPDKVATNAGLTRCPCARPRNCLIANFRTTCLRSSVKQAQVIDLAEREGLLAATPLVPR